MALEHGTWHVGDHGHQPQTQPWMILEWMEEKDPYLPKELKELCSLSFVLWVSFSLLSFYPVLREIYIGRLLSFTYSYAAQKLQSSIAP